MRHNNGGTQKKIFMVTFVVNLLHPSPFLQVLQGLIINYSFNRNYYIDKYRDFKVDNFRFV